MTYQIEKDGSRLYVTGNTYPIKDQLKRLGAHFDGERRAWWIGSAKRAELEQLVANLASAPAPSNEQVADARLDRDRSNILGRGEYKGKSYYIVGEGQNDRGPWVRLMFRDGSKTFFAGADEVRVLKSYREPMTLDGLRAYAERMKREAAGGECECWCHRSDKCRCDSGFCSFHHDGCDSCGCEW